MKQTFITNEELEILTSKEETVKKAKLIIKLANSIREHFLIDVGIALDNKLPKIIQMILNETIQSILEGKTTIDGVYIKSDENILIAIYYGLNYRKQMLDGLINFKYYNDIDKNIKIKYDGVDIMSFEASKLNECKSKGFLLFDDAKKTIENLGYTNS